MIWFRPYYLQPLSRHYVMCILLCEFIFISSALFIEWHGGRNASCISVSIYIYSTFTHHSHRMPCIPGIQFKAKSNSCESHFVCTKLLVTANHYCCSQLFSLVCRTKRNIAQMDLCENAFPIVVHTIYLNRLPCSRRNEVICIAEKCISTNTIRTTLRTLKKAPLATDAYCSDLTALHTFYGFLLNLCVVYVAQ